jgi:fibronectin-binding autotransporter adhesin
MTNIRGYYVKKVLVILFLIPFFSFMNAQRKVEKLGRGIVAINKGGGQVFVSWRLLAEDPSDISFNLYQKSDGGAETKINTSPLTNSTSYLVSGVSTSVSNEWYVKPVVGGIEQTASGPFVLPAGAPVRSYLVLELEPLPNYSVNHVYIGDLDGDGEYDYVVKRVPGDAANNVMLEAYMRDGTFKWRVDLGSNVEQGASTHNPFVLVHDFDCDGKAEVFVRTGEGTAFADGDTIGDVNSDGISDYRTLPPISLGYMILSDNCPEFVSMIDGMTGAELARADNIDRGAKADWDKLWGDSYGHRMNMNFVGVAYLDGIHPSIISSRGEGHVMDIEALDFNNDTFTRRWTWSARTNSSLSAGTSWRQFHDAWIAGGAQITGIPSGYHWADFHNIRILDLDGDGKDEISWGVNAMDDNGTPLYFAQSDIGHGDRFVISDIDPDREGLECYAIQQAASTLAVLYDAATGERIKTWGSPNPYDVGRGDAGDIDPRYKGLELWSYAHPGVLSCKGKQIANSFPHPALSIWWDGDLLRESLDAAGKEGYNPVINKWNYSTSSNDRYFTMYNEGGSYSTHCPYAGRVALYGDFMGDWREEVVCTNTENTELRIFTSTVSTDYRLYCLMQNPEYRLCINLKAYLPSTETDFYLGNGMATPPVPPILDAKCRWTGGSAGNIWDINTTANWKVGNSDGVYTDGDDVMFDILGDGQTHINLSVPVSPAVIRAITPIDYSVSGSGKITGSTSVIKSGGGSFALDIDADYTGDTKVDQGELYINKSLSASQVWVNCQANIGGSGSIAQPITFVSGAGLSPGTIGSVDTLTINNNLELNGGIICKFDLSDDTSGTTKNNDHLLIKGNLVLAGNNTLKVNCLDEKLGAGDYVLITYTGSLTGDMSNLEVTGIFGQKYTLRSESNAIVLNIAKSRDPGTAVWSGAGDAWDLLTSMNWLFNAQPDVFAAYDTVIFNSAGDNNPVISLSEILPVSGVSVDVSSNNYTITGTGGFIGDADLNVKGTGTLSLKTLNGYTGKTSVSLSTLEVNKIDNAGQESSIGASSNKETSQIVFDNATLKYVANDDQYTNRGMTLTGTDTIDIATTGKSLTLTGLIAGTGGLVKNGPGTLLLKGQSNTYSGGLTVLNGMLAFGDESANTSGPGTGSVTLKGGTLNMLNSTSSYNTSYWNIIVPEGADARLNADGRCELRGTLTGSGTLTLWTPFVRTDLYGNWSDFTGKINVVADNDGGDFRVQNSYGYPQAAIYLSDKVYAYKNGGGSVTIGELSGSTNAHMTGTSWTVGTKNTNSVYYGYIDGNSLTKVGTGSLTLTNANTYTDSTLIKEGKLLVNNKTGSGTGTGSVVVYSGAALGGSGFVSGKIKVSEGGAIEPGSDMGTLTVTNNITLETGSKLIIDIDKATGKNDLLVLSASKTLTINGNLTVNIMNDSVFADGDEFTVLSCNDISGQFVNISPASPGSGLEWNTDSLYTSGVLKVVKKVVNEQPNGIILSQSKGIDVYPNPASDILFVDATYVSQQVEIEIVSIIGGTVKTFTASKGINSVDISGLKPGLYFVKFSSNKFVGLKSFVKE